MRDPGISLEVTRKIRNSGEEGFEFSEAYFQNPNQTVALASICLI